MTQSTQRRLIRGVAAPAAAMAAFCLFAQSPAPSGSSASNDLYKAWRETDPALEADAAAGGDAVADRASKNASRASAYWDAHARTLKETAAQQAQNLDWLNINVIQALPDLAPAADGIRFANRESSAVSASVATFGNDPDRAIQQLRQAFQQEQAALQALRTSITQRQQAEDHANVSTVAAELDRRNAVREYTFLASALTQSVEAVTQESSDWTAYYAKLAEAAKAVIAPPASTTAPGGTQSASVTPRPPSITPVPLSRYVGLWSYRAGSAFFGSQPEMVDLAVHEDKGHATGTFFARFKLPPGGTGDPVVRFQFSGDFKPTLRQSFKLTTDDGITGTMDLNPGIAFNELEVNFTTDAASGKILQGDMLLLKQ